ncbi:MAG: zf-HC2 domain-containing protein [Candidatus Omnitrophica bacterium]|nr:zf-HC2 domain-containing protein [Candidatus Omnitrophota bacterium]
MSSCKEIQEFFSQYLDGVLDEEKSRIVKEHISSCAICRQELEKLSKMSKLLGGLERKQPPPYFLKMLHERMKSRKSLDKFLEGLLKNPNVKVPVTLSIIVLFTFVLLQITGQHKRSMQGRLHGAADEIGEQYSPGMAEYEPTSGARMALSQTQNRGKKENMLSQVTENVTEATTKGFSTQATVNTGGMAQQQNVTQNVKSFESDKFPSAYTVTVKVANTAKVVEEVKTILNRLAIKTTSFVKEKPPAKNLVLTIEVPADKLAIFTKELNKLGFVEANFSTPLQPQRAYSVRANFREDTDSSATCMSTESK